MAFIFNSGKKEIDNILGAKKGVEMLEFVPNFFAFFEKEKEEILNILFPPVCGICGKINENWICDDCKKRIRKFEKFKLIQGKENIENFLNFNNYKNHYHSSDFYNQIHLNKNYMSNDFYVEQSSVIDGNINDEKIYFDEFLYCFDYKGVIRKLLLRYKFSNGSYLSNFFANIILNNKIINETFKIYDIIIPVPMDKLKKSKRGYNQTELIVDLIEKRINAVKINNQKEKNNNKNDLNILVNKYSVLKVRQTKTQSTLNSDERKQNIKDAFCVKKVDEIKGKNIILFDDICTTGSTVNEISRILKKVGANKILVLVISKD